MVSSKNGTSKGTFYSTAFFPHLHFYAHCQYQQLILWLQGPKKAPFETEKMCGRILRHVFLTTFFKNFQDLFFGTRFLDLFFLVFFLKNCTMGFITINQATIRFGRICFELFLSIFPMANPRIDVFWAKLPTKISEENNKETHLPRMSPVLERFYQIMAIVRGIQKRILCWNGGVTWAMIKTLVG